MTFPEASDPGLPSVDRRTVDRRYWVVLLARAVAAIIVAVIITFSADHSAYVGALAFGAFAIASGPIGLAAARLVVGIARTVSVVVAALSIVAGAASLVLHDAGIAVLLFVIGAWAAITGALELYIGIRDRGYRSTSRDTVFAGALTALLALVVVLVPPGFVQVFTGPDGVTRELSASVILVGVFGAYAAILGVYLTIGALSLKWSTGADAVASGVHS